MEQVLRNRVEQLEAQLLQVHVDHAAQLERITKDHTQVFSQAINDLADLHKYAQRQAIDTITDRHNEAMANLAERLTSEHYEEIRQMLNNLRTELFRRL